MNNNNNIIISVLFSFDNSAKFVTISDAIKSLVFGVKSGDEEVLVELDVEYVEEDENEIEIEVLLQKGDFLSMINIFKNPYTLIIGTIDDEIKVEPTNLSIKEIVEFGEDEDIRHSVDSLENMQTNETINL